jgi:hypothetical protein
LIYQYFGLTAQDIALVEDTCSLFDKGATPPTLESARNNLRIRLHRDPQLRDRPVEIDREAVIDDEETGAEGRLDLRFLFSTGSRKPWPYFAIEAKRLHVSFDSGWKSLVPEYVTGHQGIMCFITGRYSKGLRAGAMLGYVFDGGVEMAAKSISRALKKHRSLLKLDPPHRLARSAMFGCEFWTAEENRHGGSLSPWPDGGVRVMWGRTGGASARSRIRENAGVKGCGLGAGGVCGPRGDQRACRDSRFSRKIRAH